MNKIIAFISYVFNYRKNKVILENNMPILKCGDDGIAVYGGRRYRIKRLHVIRNIPEIEIREMMHSCKITKEYYVNLHMLSMIKDIKPYIEVEEVMVGGICRLKYRIMVGERIYPDIHEDMEES